MTFAKAIKIPSTNTKGINLFNKPLVNLNFLIIFNTPRIELYQII